MIIKYQNIKNKIKLMFMRICNCDDILYSFIMKWLAYCITGETKLQKFLLILGCAGNGKSTLLDIMEMVFPIYVTKTQSNTFDASYKNAFKQIKDTATGWVVIHPQW